MTTSPTAATRLPSAAQRKWLSRADDNGNLPTFWGTTGRTKEACISAGWAERRSEASCVITDAGRAALENHK
ncbi:hypothetical protein ABMY26_07170 (plasmid) [Azospirillum sp. HJ39]|uniref:hypothetical protein n=1 Tax=Azospirillum sp. HJ39 TaxID=3159496 RepID=UPI003558B09C